MQGQAKVNVLTDISFSFDFNHNYAIIGASGAGKSTLMQILAGIDRPDSGEVNWCDQFIINYLTQDEKALFWNQKVGLIFQQPSLINELTVLENVALKGLIGNISGCDIKATELLCLLGMESRLNFYPPTLSRGEQQRVAIARAIMGNSGLILADEPTASLDRNNGEIVIDLLIGVAKKYQIGLIISTHDEYVYNKLDKIVTVFDCKLNLTS